MLGILMVMSLGMTEKIAMLFLIRSKISQEAKIVFNFTIALLIFGAISIMVYDKFNFDFFKDEKFYIAILLENISFYIAINNYNKQKNFSQIAFASFSSIYLITIIGYVYPLIFDFSSMISSPYQNTTEVIFYSLFFFTLTIVYFYDKVKNKDIKHPLELVLYAIFLVNTMFFAIYMFQTHQTFLAYMVIFSTLILQQILWIKRRHGNGEILEQIFLKNIKKSERMEEFKNMIFYSLFWILTFMLSVFASKIISVEFITLFKRIGQIVSSKVIDYTYNEKGVPTPLKDVLVLVLIMSASLYLFYR